MAVIFIPLKLEHLSIGIFYNAWVPLTTTEVLQNNTRTSCIAIPQHHSYIMYKHKDEIWLKVTYTCTKDWWRGKGIYIITLILLSSHICREENKDGITWGARSRTLKYIYENDWLMYRDGDWRFVYIYTCIRLYHFRFFFSYGAVCNARDSYQLRYSSMSENCISFAYCSWPFSGEIVENSTSEYMLLDAKYTLSLLRHTNYYAVLVT